MSGSINRRTLLRGVAASAVVAGVAGCNTTGKQSTNTTTANAGVTLPAYIPYTGLKPDLPGTEEGVDPAFRTYPAQRPKATSGKAGKGEAISGMGNIYYAIPPGVDRNPYWAGLNDALGVDLRLQMVPNADYTQKFATTIAGADLPDVLQMQTVANYPQLLDKRFTRLDEYLAGDNVKEYPNLANIPSRTWKSTVFNGGIYGVPIPRGAIGSYNFVRQDLFEEVGASVDPKSYSELVDTCKKLTDTAKRRWAFGMISQARQLLARINDEPNVWKEEGGKLTHTYETEQYKQSVQDLSDLWKSGVMHPDAFNPAQPFKQLFNAGTVAINAHDGYPGWTQYILDNAKNPGFKLGLMTVPKRNGGGLASWHYGGGVFSISGLKKQDSPEKTKLILRVLNWLAAPFGTEEYTYRLFGKEGRDHTLVNGNPTFTREGTTNTVLPIRYMADSPFTIYQPGRPGDADIQHAYQSKEIPGGKANPTIGLFSNAAATLNAPADTAFLDKINDIIQGRQPFSELAAATATWKTAVGDAMRKEFETQLQEVGGTSATPK